MQSGLPEISCFGCSQGVDSAETLGRRLDADGAARKNRNSSRAAPWLDGLHVFSGCRGDKTEEWWDEKQRAVFSTSGSTRYVFQFLHVYWRKRCIYHVVVLFIQMELYQCYVKSFKCTVKLFVLSSTNMLIAAAMTKSSSFWLALQLLFPSVLISRLVIMVFFYIRDRRTCEKLMKITRTRTTMREEDSGGVKNEEMQATEIKRVKTNHVLFGKNKKQNRNQCDWRQNRLTETQVPTEWLLSLHPVPCWMDEAGPAQQPHWECAVVNCCSSLGRLWEAGRGEETALEPIPLMVLHNQPSRSEKVKLQTLLVVVLTQ